MSKRLKILIFTGCTLFALLPCNRVLGDSSGHSSWHTLATQYTIIHYQSLEDLKKFNRKIDYSPDQWGFARLFSSSDSSNLSGEVAQKVDAVYRRAQEILGMRKKAAKVNIKIYSDEKELHAAYLNVHEFAYRNYQPAGTVRAWYTHERNTIYLNKNDLHEGMLAHEMAHSIVDHYLSVRPPRATAEILARYVDSHLLY